MCLNPEKDKLGGKLEKQSRFAKEITGFNEQHNLVDIWRVKNPDTLRFTRRQNNPIVYTRLDYWLITDFLMFKVENVNICHSIHSDHSLIKLQIRLWPQVKRGPGMWKFNCSLLHDQEYINVIKELIKSYKEDNWSEMADKGLAWDFLKCKIRGESVAYSVKKKKEQKKRVRPTESNYCHIGGTNGHITRPKGHRAI